MSTLRKIAEFQVSTLMTMTRVYRDAAHNEYVVKIVSAGQTKARPEENYFTSDKGDAMRTAQSIAGWSDAKTIQANAHGEFGWLTTKESDVTPAFWQHLCAALADIQRNDPLANPFTREYAIQLQGYAAYDARAARVHRECAMDLIEQGREGFIVECDIANYRSSAVQDQEDARRRFEKIAGVRGLFDTPAMDDAHAVEVEPSRIGPPFVRRVARALPVGFPVCFMTDEEIQANAHAMAQARFDSASTSYRERAFNCYGRYAMYCARAAVAPLPFAEWFADCYSGNEYDRSANWN